MSGIENTSLDLARTAACDVEFMQRALQLADLAERQGEVPVGSVVVRNEQIVGEGWNRTIELHDPSAHAEIIAIREAGAGAGNYRLPGCTLYVSLEPCAMCVAACIHARIDRLVYGASDPKTGALGGQYDLLQIGTHNHAFDVTGGVMQGQCADKLRRFFGARRKTRSKS